MARQIQTKRFFLIAQIVLLLPLGHIDRLGRINGDFGLFEPEHVVLTCCCGASRLVSAGEGFGHLVHECTARNTEIAHSACLDHCLEGTAVDLVVLNTPAKFCQV